MQAIHRDDGELCGFVVAVDGAWHALAVFGGLLAVTDSAAAATAVVRETGLSALGERWLLTTPASPEEELVCLQEASPAGVTVAVGFSSLPGVPTRRITRDELERGDVRLRRAG